VFVGPFLLGRTMEAEAHRQAELGPRDQRLPRQGSRPTDKRKKLQEYAAHSASLDEEYRDVRL
jgi:hypothetical protein